ncbi:MAG: hypothetical protein J0H39_20720 [Alphaproteobacteria bacterium]|nr:hypothetical protein [Alphaproteobacteria bacterium]
MTLLIFVDILFYMKNWQSIFGKHSCAGYRRFAAYRVACRIVLPIFFAPLVACAPSGIYGPYGLPVEVYSQCNEAPHPGPSACTRGPLSLVPLADPRGCVPYAASRETSPARRASVETLCRDNVLDTEGRVLVSKARLADRIEAAESARRLSGDPARQAQAAADLAVLRELIPQAPAE